MRLHRLVFHAQNDAYQICERDRSDQVVPFPAPVPVDMSSSDKRRYGLPRIGYVA